MKRCPSCHNFYEDSLTTCPGCRVALVLFASDSAQTVTQVSGRDADSTSPRAQNEPERDQTYVFERHRGSHVIINGSIADVNTQQYYQSRGTKLFRSLFNGEPYQLGHTTFITILRVEEHVRSAFPEQARDVILYGDTRNVFVTGDDVTINAIRRRDRLVARSIFSHSIEHNIRTSPNIPALLIRFLTLFLLYFVYRLIRGVVTADYAAIGRGISGTLSMFFNILLMRLSSLLPVIATVAIAIYLLIRLLRGR